MASKKIKYASMAGIGLMTLSLVACANETEQYQTLGDSGLTTPEQTFKTGAKNESKCPEYELQKDGSYKCDDDGTSGGNSGVAFVPLWFFNGTTYNSHSSMVASNDYKNNNLTTGTKYKSESNKNNSKNQVKNNSKNGGSNNSKSGSSGKSGGFGSGGRGSSGGS